MTGPAGRIVVNSVTAVARSRSWPWPERRLRCAAIYAPRRLIPMVVLSIVVMAVCVLPTVPTARAAGSLPIVDAGGFYQVRLPSYRDSKFNRVIPQAHDFSCGSAAMATLLTYHYGRPTTEKEVLEEMMLFGNTERILTQGFSMGDMKDYLERHGYQSGGYQAPLDVLVKARIPGVVLISTKGFMHFVVVKGVAEGYVLVGDPALGVSIQSREEFEKTWTGVVFVVTDHDTRGREFFNHEAEWKSWWVRPRSPNAMALNMRQDLSSFLLTLSNPVTNFTTIPGGPNIIERLF
jgi:hypothetical protein